MNILLIEDEPALRRAIADYMESEGYMVTVADTLRKGQEKANDYDYDCIVVDLMLPDGSGLDLVRDFGTGRRSPACRHPA